MKTSITLGVLCLVLTAGCQRSDHSSYNADEKGVPQFKDSISFRVPMRHARRGVPVGDDFVYVVTSESKIDVKPGKYKVLEVEGKANLKKNETYQVENLVVKPNADIILNEGTDLIVNKISAK